LLPISLAELKDKLRTGFTPISRRDYSLMEPLVKSVTVELHLKNLLVFLPPPQAEEAGFDFGNEFDMNMLTGCTMTFATQPTNYTVTKGAYVTEEETYSEQSTTQASSQIGSNSPFRADPTDVISYDVPETLFYRQPSQYRPFNLAPIEHDSQVDDMLSKVTNYFVENTNRTSVSSEIDSFFSEEKSSDDDESSDRLSQLSMRKAYLELALAKTLKEMKDF